MKKTILLLLAMVLQMGAQIAVNAQELTVSDIQNSGCLGSTRADGQETIILTKEGDILEVQLFNYVADCAAYNFSPNVSSGSDGESYYVSIKVGHTDGGTDCLCPYNISFNIHGLETNSFFFTCRWYQGQVNLTEGEPLVLGDINGIIMEEVSIDGLNYTLEDIMHTATLVYGSYRQLEGELNIPSELNYKGQKYSVKHIGEYALAFCYNLTSITIPNSVTSIDRAAFFECNSLADVYCYADNVPTTERNVFSNTPITSATLYVPAGSIDLYKTTSPWSEFGNIVEIPHQPLPFLEGNPIWVYKYEHIPRLRDPNIICWIDTGDRVYTYYFLGRQNEIEGKVYTMMGEVECSREGEITLNRWYPVREENGIVYTITDSLPRVVEFGYDDVPYLEQGNECVLYNFSAEIGGTLYKNHVVKSFDTYQLIDGTVCRVLKTNGLPLYEKLGYRDDDGTYGVIDPLWGIAIATNGHAYTKCLNAYYQDDTMLYKAPDAPEGLCVNDTIWTTLDDTYIYARSYKADPYHDDVMAYIRQLQTTPDPVTFTQGQMATIILPMAPDASKGKYYRLDKCEDGQIIFKQELQPQARVPYIIIPNEDFSIDPSTMDLEGLSHDAVSIEGISFIGSYSHEEFSYQEGFYIDIIDTTPDCLDDWFGSGKAIVGPLRAYLQVNWDDPYTQGGTKDPQKIKEIVLHNHGTGINEIQDSKLKIQNEGVIFDLQGRKISGKPAWGVYIKEGKKRMVK